MKYDWSKITTLAYQTLIELNISEFPVSINKIRPAGVRVTSYQNYSKKTGLPIDLLTLNHELDDAFFLQELRPGLKLILYNKDKYGPRLKHSLWHEVGHIKCNHKKHSEKEEIEAHFFAAQANAPNAVIKEIAKRGYSIDILFLQECFGLSEKSARKKKDYLNKYNFDHYNEYDDVIIKLFIDYINKNYPSKVDMDDNYYDDLEADRNNWY